MAEDAPNIKATSSDQVQGSIKDILAAVKVFQPEPGQFLGVGKDEYAFIMSILTEWSAQHEQCARCQYPLQLVWRLMYCSDLGELVLYSPHPCHEQPINNLVNDLVLSLSSLQYNKEHSNLDVDTNNTLVWEELHTVPNLQEPGILFTVIILIKERSLYCTPEADSDTAKVLCTCPNQNEIEFLPSMSNLIEVAPVTIEGHVWVDIEAVEWHVWFRGASPIDFDKTPTNFFTKGHWQHGLLLPVQTGGTAHVHYTYWYYDNMKKKCTRANDTRVGPRKKEKKEKGDKKEKKKRGIGTVPGPGPEFPQQATSGKLPMPPASQTPRCSTHRGHGTGSTVKLNTEIEHIQTEPTRPTRRGVDEVAIANQPINHLAPPSPNKHKVSRKQKLGVPNIVSIRHPGPWLHRVAAGEEYGFKEPIDGPESEHNQAHTKSRAAEEPNIPRSGYDCNDEPLEGYDGDVLQDDPEEAFYLPGPQPQERSNMEPEDNGYDEEFDNGAHSQQDRHINWDDDNDMQNDGLDLVLHPDGQVHTTFNALLKWANVPPNLANTIPKPSNVPAKSDLNTHITQSHLENKGGYESGSKGGDKEDKGEEDVMDYPCAYKVAMKLKFYLPMWRKVLHITCMFPNCMDIVEDEFGSEILLQSIEEFKAKCSILNMSYYEKYAYKMKIWMYSDLGDLWSAVKKVTRSALTETFNIKPANALMEEDVFAHVKSHYTQLHENSRLFHNFHDDGTVENSGSMALTQTCVHVFYDGKMTLAAAFPEKFGRILPGGTHIFSATMCKQVKSDNFEMIYDELHDLFDKVEDSRHYDVLEARHKQIAMLGWFLAGAACICLCYMDAQPPPDDNDRSHQRRQWPMAITTEQQQLGTYGYFQPAKMILSSHAVDLTSIDGGPWLSPLDDDDDDQYVIDSSPWLSPLDDNDNELYILGELVSLGKLDSLGGLDSAGQITTTWAGWGAPVQFWADPNPSGKSGCLDRSGQYLSRPVQKTSTLLMVLSLA
ncbi:hypothetical protein EDC04DRAFT_2610699 [Pisolithus marmoratus]|nr:hypothetical protein EDC04DRAFT_2610699 [Pisolithus marmoratus]